MKPLGRKAFGSIPHLPGSRLGPGDHHCNEGQSDIATVKTRNRHDRVIVTEKIDGSNVAIARKGDEILALTRAGYMANTSNFAQHHVFHEYVQKRADLFAAVLADGQLLHGEWMLQVHGLSYSLKDPFIAFALTSDGKPEAHDSFISLAGQAGIETARVISDGPAISIEDAMNLLGEHGFHGCSSKPEGVVYRVETRGALSFMAKYVRPDKIDGKYMEEERPNDLPEIFLEEYERIKKIVVRA